MLTLTCQLILVFNQRVTVALAIDFFGNNSSKLKIFFIEIKFYFLPVTIKRFNNSFLLITSLFVVVAAVVVGVGVVLLTTAT